MNSAIQRLRFLKSVLNTVLSLYPIFLISVRRILDLLPVAYGRGNRQNPQIRKYPLLAKRLVETIFYRDNEITAYLLRMAFVKAVCHGVAVITLLLAEYIHPVG